MNRRDFFKKSATTVLSGTAVSGLVGCGRESMQRPIERGFEFSRRDETVTLYDTYAQALYFDGTMGPKTGIVKVDYILADRPVVIEFWHGHGGSQHRYILTPAHFHDLKQLKRVYLYTDEVANHKHKLFIDPTDPRWRVPGAQPVQVPLEPRGGR